ncbi:MAG: dTDP-4-dehydrorhamnose 3,5-epimerase [Paludibacteraceae bacterium]|nr:dTDP-4-dehydrorhamnose 3,5-epimerase [Paludibacteraceae bacterium]MBP6283929.1 dTDP-4-dehydrorhamnose 3,5-epimerase [Paludibacteraceae bacterium]
MEIIKTKIPGLLIVQPKVFGDHRGYFCETYNEEAFHVAGIKNHFCQDNLSKSSYGVIRGLHFQLNPQSQAKLVSAVVGCVYDVAVDLRQGSPTYGEWVGIELSEDNKTQFFIPQGFAHGFSVLSETAIFSYKCDNLYNPSKEGGLLYNDATLNIDWKIPADKQLISDKDTKNPTFNELKTNFVF